MIAAESTIVERNSHVNGYRFELFEDVKAPETAPVKEQAAGQRQDNDAAPGLAESRDEVPPEAPPTSSDSAKAKPSEKVSTARADRTKPAKGKAARKRTSKPPKVKYVPQAKLDAELARLEELSHAAMAGDTQALDELRAELDHCPHVWRYLADLQRLVEERMIEVLGWKDPLRIEAFRKRCSEFRHQILDSEPASFATKLAASCAVSCWMFCQFHDLRALEVPDDVRWGKERYLAQQSFGSAMRTFLRARQSDLQLQRLANA